MRTPGFRRMMRRRAAYYNFRYGHRPMKTNVPLKMSDLAIGLLLVGGITVAALVAMWFLL